jgi:hypothetical protein
MRCGRQLKCGEDRLKAEARTELKAVSLFSPFRAGDLFGIRNPGRLPGAIIFQPVGLESGSDLRFQI